MTASPFLLILLGWIVFFGLFFELFPQCLELLAALSLAGSAAFTFIVASLAARRLPSFQSLCHGG